MTLYRQLILAISFLIVGLMAGNVFVSVVKTRGHVFEQMQVHAQDTATSLGLTISHAAQAKDEAQIRLFISVVFDRGYYRYVAYRSLSGDLLIESRAPAEIEGVPAWFVRLMDLPEPSGTAEVISGWHRLGEVKVVSHPGSAYRDLWRVLQEQLLLLVITVVLSYLLAGLGLRYLLQPLRRVEEQAEAICRREFPVQEKLPRTRELKRMVMAMNRMVQKIQAMFQEQVELTESLRSQAYQDSVTGLSNREDFDARLRAFLQSERSGGPAILVLVHLTGLESLNRTQGREAGDDCLRSMADVLRTHRGGRDGVLLGRRSGADLSLFVPLLDRAEGEQLIDDLFEQLQASAWPQQSELLGLHLGIAYSAATRADQSLLAQADLALRQAQHQGPSGVQWQDVSSGQPARPAGEWCRLLQQALAERRFTFHLQPVFERDGKTVMQLEVLCRLPDGEQLINAGVFLPMAERFGLAAAIDRQMIEQLAGDFARARGPRLCVNISPASVADAGFVEWLEAFLAERPEFARRLLLELPEQALAASERSVRLLGRRLTALGVHLSLDHFGVGAAAFSYLQSLPLLTLKVDRCFIHNIHSNADHRFFVKSLLQIAHSCDVRLLAEGVESAEEWQALLALGIDGGQGYFLARPSPAGEGA